MGLDRSTPISAVQLTSTPLPVGWKYAEIGDSDFRGNAIGGGKSQLIGVGGTAQLITKVLQGGLLFEQPEEYVGVPTQNTPIIDVVFAPSVAGIYRVLQVNNNKYMIVSDPTGSLDGLTGVQLYGLCSRFDAPMSIEMNGVANTFGAIFLDGTTYSGCPANIKFNGTPLEPVLFSSSDNATATITR